MKIRHHHKLTSILFLTAFFFVITAYGDDSAIQKRIEAAQIEGSVVKLSSLAAECEIFWPSNAPLYFQFEAKIGEALEVLTKTNSAAVHEIENQSEKVLSKDCPVDPSLAITCFGSKLQIAERFIRTSSFPNAHDAQILAKFLGEVRTTIITNYQWQQVDLNIMPPIAPTNSRMGVFSGMDPNAISDPVARAAYEKAIDKNNMRGFENNLQLFTLPDANKTMTLLFLDYVKKLFVQNPEARKQIDELAALAHLIKSEKNQLQ